LTPAEPLGVEEVLAQLDEASPNGTQEGQAEAIERMRRLDLTPAAEIYLRVCEVRELAHRGGRKEALDRLDLIEAEVERLRPPPEGHRMSILVGGIASVRGMVLGNLNRHEESLGCYEVARECYERAGQTWRLSGIMVNTAIAFYMERKPKEAMELLREAEAMGERADVPAAWHAARRAMIGVNRSGFLHATGDVEGSIAELLAARPAVVEVGDDLTLGHVNFNLASFYLAQGRFGSSLEAARAAAANYRAGGSGDFHRKAVVSVAEAMVKLGRYREAGALLGRLIDSIRSDSIGEAYMPAALNVLESVYRGEGRDAEADRMHRLQAELDTESPPELQALNVVMTDLLDAVNLLVKRGVPVRSTASKEAIELILNSEQENVPALGRVVEGIVEAFYSGKQPEPLTDHDREVLLIAGQDPGEWQDIIELALGLRNRDEERTLEGNLRDLVRFQALAGTQEGPGYRRDLLASRGGNTLDVILAILLRRGHSDSIFELIEWCRREFGDEVASEAPQLLSFSSVSSGVADTGPTSLAEPVGISVGGRSELARASPGLAISAEAHDLRRDLVGEDGAWWTAMVHRGVLFWALLAPEGSASGSVSFTGRVRAAFRRHFEALPVPLVSDVDGLDADVAPWCGNAIAIARAAGGPLLAEANLVGHCLAALPGDVAAVLVLRDPQPSPGLHEVYGPLGDFLIPPALNEFLDRRKEGAKLLVSVQPELATVPTCLLRTRNGQVLGERAAIAYAPPVGVAVELCARPRASGAASGLLISNPTGDLVASQQGWPSALDSLCGWGEAESEGQVATVENSLRSLQRLTESGDPAILSFVGHIRPGTAADPAAAALALAADSPEDEQGSFLSARDLGASGLAMPSRVYLGGCEGAGFGRSLEWTSMAAASLESGTSTVLAHRWPIVDAAHAATVDQGCTDLLLRSADVAEGLRQLQMSWLADWRRQVPGAVPPHYWAGIQAIGRA
jgi:tetratricopeptide (TPR) repeat protein